MSDELALPPVSDMRTNEEIARAIWRDLCLELTRNNPAFADAFARLSLGQATAIDAAAESFLMAALANIRGIGTA